MSMEVTPGIVRVAPIVQPVHTKQQIMSAVIDHDAGYERGLARIVYDRQGDVTVDGYIDRSNLCLMTRDGSGGWQPSTILQIEGLEQAIATLQPAGTTFVGLEDPELVTDAAGVVHIFFTIPFAGGNN